MGQLKEELALAKQANTKLIVQLNDSTKKQPTKTLPKEVLDFNKKQAKKNKPVVTGRTGN